MAADIPSAEPMRSAYLTLRPESDTEAERIFDAFPDGGKGLSPMPETWFASRFGQVRDRFGINWMIVRERSMAATSDHHAINSWQQLNIEEVGRVGPFP